MSRTYGRSVVIALSLVLILAACGRRADSDPNAITWKTYSNDEIGVTLEMPDDWTVTLDGADSLSLDHPKADVGAQVFITPAADFIGTGLDEPLAFLQMSTDAFSDNGGADNGLETLQPLTTTTIQGQPAARVTLKGNLDEANGVVVMAALTNSRSLAVIMTVDGTSDNAYSAVLERLLQSVQLSE